MMLRPRTASHLLLFCSLCVFIFAAARTTAVLVQAAEQAVVPAAALDEQIAAATTTRVDSSVQCGAAMTDSDCPAEQRLFDRNHVCSDNQCTQEKCCKTSCHSITCEGQYTRKASYDEIFGGDISLTRCCDRNCRVFTNGCYHYGRRFSERANPASIHCPNHRCTKWICCVPNCYWADCPEEQFVYKLSNPKLQLCGLTNNCNIAECCRRHCGSFDCVAHGQAPRTDIASNEIRCQDNDTGCTAQECCVLASTTVPL
ncbi:unnamed protein product [Amoebophrya sp. A25]|nr:unnamed protein product [Amoebophrya sp. A25]|eukprot:GSA25T00025073001.1